MLAATEIKIVQMQVKTEHDYSNKSLTQSYNTVAYSNIKIKNK